MKKLILLLTLLPCIAFGQGDTLWTKTFGIGRGQSVQQTTDGGYIIAGRNDSAAILIKTNSQGATLWTKTFGGGTNLNHHFNDVQQTTDGGYVLTGFYDDGNNAWLLKTDSLGNTLWSVIIWQSGTTTVFGLSVQQTTDGGYIITGYNVWDNKRTAFLIKTNDQGNTLWTKYFHDYKSNSVQQTTDGGYIITGSGGWTNTSTEHDLWILKTDNLGNTIWSKTFGGSGLDDGSCVKQTTDGGYIITGHTASFGNGSRDVWLLKTNNQGDSLWSKSFGGVGMEIGFSGQQTIDGGFIITGETYSFGNGESDLWLLKTDSQGDSLWTKTFGGADYEFGYSVQQTSDGGYIITGSTFSFGNGAPYAIWLIKTVGQSILSTSFTNPDLSKDRKLEKVVDLLGRPSLPVPNQILLYKYSDGSVEKRIQLER